MCIEIKISNIKESQYDTPLSMELFAFDGEKIEYIEGELDTFSFNEIVELLDREKAAFRELLYSKHKLYLNDDGSFRVLIIADAHMSINGNAEDVQEVKDRIKLLVDREEPNLVIFTGDNTIGSSSEEKLRQNITALVSYIITCVSTISILFSFYLKQTVSFPIPKSIHRNI